MKIARFVFAAVLLASALFVPAQPASAVAEADVDVLVGAPDFASGTVTYPVTVTFAISDTRSAPLDAVVVVSFDEEAAITGITNVSSNGTTVTFDDTTKDVTIREQVMVGSLPISVTFNVVYSAGGLPVGTSIAPQYGDVTATISEQGSTTPLASSEFGFIFSPNRLFLPLMNSIAPTGS